VAFIHAEAIADDALTASWVTPPPDDRPSTNRVNPSDYAFYWKARHRERESHEARTGGFYGDNSKRYQRNIAREFAARFNRKHLSRSISLLLVHANQKGPFTACKKKPPVTAAFEACGAPGEAFDRRFLHPDVSGRRPKQQEL